jgi:hypothetical protein
VPLPFGDVNADGLVNSLDYLCVLNYLAGKPRTPTCPYDPPVTSAGAPALTVAGFGGSADRRAGFLDAMLIKISRLVGLAGE